MAASKPRKDIPLMDVLDAWEKSKAAGTQVPTPTLKASIFDEPNVLVGGTRIRTHRAGDCIGYWCCIHNQSPHHMVKWKQVFDSVDRVMLRVCDHGMEHIDPDDNTPSWYAERHAESCDGCCKPDGHVRRRVQ